MSTVLCDLGAWITYASRAPLTPIPKEEADRVLREATCTAQQARAVRDAPWWQRTQGLARALTGLPDSREPDVSLAIADETHRRTRKGVRAHHVPPIETADSVWRIEEPFGLDEAAYVVAPTLYLLLRARLLNLPGLVATAASLCSTYELHLDLERPLIERPPLLSVPSLRAFAQGLPANTTKGDLLRRAARLTPSLSRSPMETALALLLSLPLRHGGFGLPLPELNPPIDLGPDAQRVLGGQRRIFVDLLWPEASVGVEYDSNEHHSSRQRHLADERRQLAADIAGLELVPWTASTVMDETAFSLAAEHLALRLGAPFSWDLSHVESRRALRARLLGPHRFW